MGTLSMELFGAIAGPWIQDENIEQEGTAVSPCASFSPCSLRTGAQPLSYDETCSRAGAADLPRRLKGERVEQDRTVSALALRFLLAASGQVHSPCPTMNPAVGQGLRTCPGGRRETGLSKIRTVSPRGGAFR